MDVTLKIEAFNAERSSLFNAADEAHYIGDVIVGLVFLGENYPLVEEPEEKSTNHPCLYIKKDYRSYYLCFGPLDGELDMDEDLVILFKNGVQWIIRYRCCDHDEVSLSCTREWYFNGEKTYNPMHLRPTS